MAQLDVLAGRYAGSKELLKSFKKANITDFGDTEIVLARANQQLTVSGSGFVQSADGEIISGTVSGLAYRERGILELTIGDLNIPATDFERILGKASAKSFDQAAFAGDDVLNGGEDRDDLEADAGNDQLSGADGNDALSGGDGDNRLDGGAGKDQMRGGDGDDTYIVDNSGDIVIESKNGGNDTVEANVSYALGGDIEILRLTGSAAINGEGDKAGNLILGNAGANELDGNAGDDVLDGGAGIDTLTGAKGADRFVISTLVGGADRIEDFNVRQGDVLDLRQLFAFAGEDPTGFIELRGSGKVTEVFVDADGGGDGFTPVASVEGDLGLDLSTLVNQGVILYRPEG